MTSPSAFLQTLKNIQKLVTPYKFLWRNEIYQDSNLILVLLSCSTFKEQIMKSFIDIRIAHNISPYFWSSVCFSADSKNQLIAPIKEGLSVVHQKHPYHLKLSVFCFENEASFYHFCSQNLSNLTELSLELTSHVDMINNKEVKAKLSTFLVQ